VYERDARRARVARRDGPVRAPFELHRTLVRGELAGHDGEQRALARAVLADQRVDLARRQLEVHAVEGDRGPEPLPDPAQPQGQVRSRLEGG
jgi:hypothetical protein